VVDNIQDLCTYCRINGCQYDTIDKLLDEKYDQISDLLDVIRSIYAIAGEDPAVNRLCNKILEDSRFATIL